MMTTDVETYFARGCGRCDRFDTPDCSTRRWADGLAALRDLCRAAGLAETAKWGHPCYVEGARNVAIIGAFRDDFRLTFFDAALLADPERVLSRQGPNTRHPDAIRFTANADVDRLAPVIRAYLAEARGHAAAGRKPPKDESALELPAELADAMAADGALAAAFAALTPGRQRSHVLAIASAKAAATRVTRIERQRAAILAGRGANER